MGHKMHFHQKNRFSQIHSIDLLDQVFRNILRRRFHFWGLKNFKIIFWPPKSAFLRQLSELRGDSMSHKMHFHQKIDFRISFHRPSDKSYMGILGQGIHFWSLTNFKTIFWPPKSISLLEF